MMENTFLFWAVEGLLLMLATIGGWFLRQLWSAVSSLKVDLSSLEVKIARDYVPYDRLQDALKPIMESLVEIKDSLKHKVDK
jgi:septation ring formation regulator EzrA